MSDTTIKTSESSEEYRPRKIKKKRQVWRTSSSLVSIELKWRDEEYQKYLVRCENLWKKIREEKQREREYHKYFLNLLVADIGPPWYQELSNPQRDSLATLYMMIHMDVGQGTPSRTMRVLADLGILPRYKSVTVMGVLKRCEEDPILFLKELYNAVYEHDPSETQEHYILEQKLIMSSMVYLSIKDIIRELERQTKYEPPPPAALKPPARQKKPKAAKSVYLEADSFIPLISTKMYKPPPPPKDPANLPDSILKKFGLLSDDEDSTNSESMSNKSHDDGRKPEEDTVALKPLDSDKKKTVKQPKQPGKGTGAQQASDDVDLPHHTQIVPLPTTAYDCCTTECECIKWYPAIVKYIDQKRWEAEELKRRQAKEKKKRDKTGTKSKSKRTLKDADSKKANDSQKSKKHEKKRFSHPIKPSTFLQVLLAEQAEDGSIVPTFPGVHKLPILQEWARQRLKGGISNEESERIRLSQNVRWRFLSSEHFQLRPPKLPFTDKELFSMDWNQRPRINKLVEELHTQYHKKLKRKLIKKAQIWWPTMEMNKFPNKTFRDVFFSYLPGREEDLYVKDVSTFM